jgi:hypothetical protein
MTQFIYRLQRLLEQKEVAHKDAEREKGRREQELEAEQEALAASQRHEKDLVQQREQMRRALLKPDRGSLLSAREVNRRCEDVYVLGIQIEDARNDIRVCRQNVEHCEARLQEAVARVGECKREVEVLAKHRAKQEERFQRAQQAQEELALDEIGNLLHAFRRRPV